MTHSQVLSVFLVLPFYSLTKQERGHTHSHRQRQKSASWLDSSNLSDQNSQRFCTKTPTTKPSSAHTPPLYLLSLWHCSFHSTGRCCPPRALPSPALQEADSETPGQEQSPQPNSANLEGCAQKQKAATVLAENTSIFSQMIPVKRQESPRKQSGPCSFRMLLLNS